MPKSPEGRIVDLIGIVVSQTLQERTTSLNPVNRTITVGASILLCRCSCRPIQRKSPTEGDNVFGLANVTSGRRNVASQRNL